MGEQKRHKERVRIAFEVDIEWTDTAREWAVDAAIRHCKFLNAMGAGVKKGATLRSTRPQRRCKVGERRVLVTIDPPRADQCAGCRHRYAGVNWHCRLGFPSDGAWATPRPAACIAAEAAAAHAAEWWALAFGGVAGPKRDRVADALAAVLGPEPVEP